MSNSKGIKKRDKMQIFLAMLNSLQKSNHKGMRISYLCHKTNISYNMGLEYSDLFLRNGLIKVVQEKYGKRFLLTERGNEFLELIGKIGGYLNK